MNWGYNPPPWLPGGHIQTIYPALFGAAICPERNIWLRERLVTPDQDFIDLDWTKDALQKNTLFVLFHGLEGSSMSHYSRAFANVLTKGEFGLVVPHFRGCGGEINIGPRAYHSGDFVEVGWILSKIRSVYAGPIWAIGVSLGGNALLRWAQEAGEQAEKDVSGVVAICAPLDLMQSGIEIGRGVNHWIYERRFLKTMKQKARQKIKQFPGLFNYERVEQSKSLYEFDNYFTAPLHGFKNTDEYWRTCSSNKKLSDIKIRHLVINALNDPLVPARSLPEYKAFNKNATTIYTTAGGHVGYVQSSLPGNLNALPELITAWTKL